MHHYRYRAPFDDAHLCVLDIETIASEVRDDGSFPPWPTHSPIVASMLLADRNGWGEWEFQSETVRFDEDEHALDRIDELLTGRSAITFNGAGFDFPVLMLAAQKARKFNLPALRAAATQPRFANLHLDLAQRYSNFGQARGGSLERLCSMLNIPVKQDVHGSDVADLYAEGEIDRIASYCERDVAGSLLLYAYHRAMETGDAPYHAALTYQFVRWICHQALDHLMPFTDVHDLRDLQRKSLITQLEAAVRNAAADADLRAKQALDAVFAEAEIVNY